MPQTSDPGTATTAVRAAHRIDRARLERYLGTHVPEAAPIRAISQFAAIAAGRWARESPPAR